MESNALSKLDNDYQVLTELHSSGDSRTYLARHLTLNRDVTITVVSATADASYIAAFAADAKILTTQRHPNVVPVIDGRWLDDNTFAVVRARVRGSTLDQLLSAVGAMPQARIAAALREISSALAWARGAGIAHRNVSPDTIVFQQGPGRALLSFEPSRVVSDDERTIRDLAIAMNGGAPMNVAEYTAMLAPAKLIPARPSQPARPTPPPATTPVGDTGQTVVVQRQKAGFGARLVGAFAVIVVLGVTAVAFKYWQDSKPQRVAVNGAIPDTQGDAAGEVALHSGRIDTAISYPTPRIIEPPTPTPTPTPQPIYPTYPPPMPTQPMPTQPMPAQSAPIPRLQPMPAPVDTVARQPVDACDSPAPGDQRRCLSSSIEKTDRELNSVYAKLIVALRRQADVADADPDPQSVMDLRAAQRRWLEDRDEVCRGTGAGLLYARDRAACFADRATARTRDLQQQLDAIP